MPKNKDFKRLTRRRMQKTGESYTTARARLLEKPANTRSDAGSARNGTRTSATKTAGGMSAAEMPPPARTDYAALAGMSDAAVRAKTGRTWAQWTDLLDAVGATKLPHRDIARHVHEEYALNGWWSQTVTVGYERIRGLRDIGQRRGGGYEAHKSKTYPVPVNQLFAAFSQAGQRRRWLPDGDITVRKATPRKSLRITWTDGTNVEVGFLAKGVTKSQVTIQHTKLPSKSDAERMKKYWAERLGALAQSLVPGKGRRQ